MELEFLTFSTLVFGILMVVCFKPLKGTYMAKEVVQNKISQQQRYKKHQEFMQELEDIKTNFDSRFAEALRGELKKDYN